MVSTVLNRNGNNNLYRAFGEKRGKDILAPNLFANMADLVVHYFNTSGKKYLPNRS